MSDSPDASGSESLAGVIIETPAGLYFVPAPNALMALDNPRLSPLPGTPLELLWFEGRVVPTASWSLLAQSSVSESVTRGRREVGLRKNASEKAALVCELSGQLLGLTGVELVSSGRYPVVRGAETSETKTTVENAEDALHVPQLRVRYKNELIETVDLASLFAAASALTRREDESRDGPHDPSDSATLHFSLEEPR